MTDRETRVQEIAYQLWVQEGRPEGRHDAHWYEAEAVYDAEAAGGEGKANPPDDLALSSEKAKAASESGKKRPEGDAQKSASKGKSVNSSPRDPRPANENAASEVDRPSSARAR